MKSGNRGFYEFYLPQPWFKTLGIGNKETHQESQILSQVQNDGEVVCPLYRSKYIWLPREANIPYLKLS